MSRTTLNLGILAHVDAGKTSLTERLLYAAGVIDEVGRVDDGTTQTDSLALERQRGITIRSAVASFAIGDVTVNLIDTPGHPDFIAEVERVLSVLDGAVLVISAVEGVQAQTRVLMRALARLHIPTLIFINKIDRPGADDRRVLAAITDRLTADAVPMGATSGLGTRAAAFRPWPPADQDARARLTEMLAGHDDDILAAYVDAEAALPAARLRTALAVQTGRAAVHPAFSGSAMTGAGVDCLMAAIPELLPRAGNDAGGPVSGSVFKIERGDAGEKVAYVRMFSGTLRTRDRLHFGCGADGKVTAISVFDRGPAVRRAAVSAGEIGKLWGMHEIRVGDQIGSSGTGGARQFPPPALESVVVAGAADRARLHAALSQLAEQDPLINLRRDDSLDEISVSLYGEVQKEVIQATLADEFGIEVTFRETTTICIERVAGRGQAIEILHAPGNPFLATLGLRVTPAPAGSGIRFRPDVDVRSIPLYVYKTVDEFSQAMVQYVRHSLREGLSGWEVTDCLVTMTDCGYTSPGTSAADFRKLTPLVLMSALEQASTTVCEPMLRVRIETPAASAGAVLSAVARLGAAGTAPSPQGSRSVIDTSLPAARTQELQRQLPGLTSGEGVMESEFGGYRPVTGTRPNRRRTTANPLNRQEYLLGLTKRAGVSAAQPEPGR
jgi:ribosomal protection tetracycline resistance protein